MSQVPVEDRTLEGYEPPRNTQFNVYLPNRVGRMLELLDLLHGHAVKVVAFTVMDTADYAVDRLLLSKPDVARKLLQRAQMPYSETEVLVVELPGRTTLIDLCRVLVSAEINIYYLYPLLARPSGRGAVVLHTDDPTMCGQVLRRKGFSLLGEHDLDNSAEPPSACR